MKKALLNNPVQIAANLATHVFEFDPTDLDAGTVVNTDLTLTAMAVPAGSVLINARAVLLDTFGNASADMTLAFSVGINSNASNVIASQSLVSSGSPVAPPRQWATTPNISANNATNLTVTFDITDTDGKLADVNTGRLRVYVMLKTPTPEQQNNL